MERAKREGCSKAQALERLSQSRAALQRARGASDDSVVQKAKRYNSRNRQANFDAGDKVASYVSQLLAPSVTPVERPPDAEAATMTGIYRSKQVVQLTTNAQGRFAALVQPTIGATSDLVNYRVASVSPTVADYNAADWSDSSNYDNSSSVQYDEDFYAVQSAITDNIYYIDGSTVGATATDILGTDSVVVDAAGSTGSYADLRYETGVGPSSADGSFKVLAGEVFGLSIVCGNTNPNSQWSGGGGNNYLVFKDQDLVNPAGAAYFTLRDEQNTGTTARGDNGYSLLIEAKKDIWIVITPAVWGGSGPTTSAIVYSRSTTGAAPLEDAVITTLRPIAYSCLTKCTASGVNNGGDVAVTFLPGNQQDEWFSNSGKNYQDWAVLAEIAEAYNGALRTGAYQWGSLEDPYDRGFKIPSEHLQMKFPSFAIAGQLAAGISQVNDVHVVTLIIDRIFEYTTVSRLFETKMSEMTINELNAANDLIRLANIPHSMENDGHGNFISRTIDYIDSGGMAKTVENLRHVAGEVKALVFSVV